MSDQAHTISAMQEEAQESSNNHGSQVADWVRGNLLWVLGLAPVVLIAVNVLYLAQDDLATTRVLLRTVDPVQAALGLALPALPVLVLSLAGYIFEGTMWGRLNPRWGVPSVLVLVAVVAAVAPAQPILFFLYGSLVLWVIIDRVRGRRGAPPAFSLTNALAISVGAAVLAGPWLATERVELRGQEPVTAYVLDTQDGWTTLLLKDGGTRIVPSPDVVARTPCNSHAPSRSITAVVLGRHQDSAPLCSELTKRVESGGPVDVDSRVGVDRKHEAPAGTGGAEAVPAAAPNQAEHPQVPVS